MWQNHKTPSASASVYICSMHRFPVAVEGSVLLSLRVMMKGVNCRVMWCQKSVDVASCKLSVDRVK